MRKRKHDSDENWIPNKHQIISEEKIDEILKRAECKDDKIITNLSSYDEVIDWIECLKIGSFLNIEFVNGDMISTKVRQIQVDKDENDTSLELTYITVIFNINQNAWQFIADETKNAVENARHIYQLNIILSSGTNPILNFSVTSQNNHFYDVYLVEVAMTPNEIQEKIRDIVLDPNYGFNSKILKSLTNLSKIKKN